MRIIVDGILPSEWRKDLSLKIKNNEIRTWKFIVEDGHHRLLHTGDEQYKDVVIRLIAPSKEELKNGIKYTHFVPTVLTTIKDKDDKSVAEGHLGIVLGRFAEILNCHYAKLVKNYQTVL